MARITLSLILVLLVTIEADARKYYDAAIFHLKGHVKKVSTTDLYYAVDFDRDGRLIRDRSRTEHDSSGKVTQFMEYGPNGELENTYKYTYDADGKVVKCLKMYNSISKSRWFPTTYFYTDGLETRSLVGTEYITYELTYKVLATDSHGNWTRRKYFKNGIEQRIEEREITYWDDSSSAKPKKLTSTPAKIASTAVGSAVSELFKYPMGNKAISWGMKFEEVRNILAGKTQNLYVPQEFRNNRNSTARFEIAGKVTADLKNIGQVEYQTETSISYSGKSSLSNLVFDRERIVIYSEFREKTRKHGFEQHLRTSHANELYEHIVEQIKAAGGKIEKWKSSDYNRLKSCKVVFEGRSFYLTLYKGISSEYKYIEISYRK